MPLMRIRKQASLRPAPQRPQRFASVFTAEQLDDVLTALEAAGYSYTRIDDAETFPLLNGVRPSRGPWVGDPCTEDADCDFAAAGTTGFCFGAGDGGAEGFCSLSCEGYCPDRDGTAPTFCIAAPTPGEGICVPRAHPLNESCAAVPGTMARETDRFVGSSGATRDRALVCAPE